VTSPFALPAITHVDRSARLQTVDPESSPRFGALLARFADLSPADRQGGLVALGALLRTVGALCVMCDPRDLGVSITEDIAGALTAFEPNLYLYDNYPGGIGQSAALFKLAPRLLDGAATLLAACPCESGCPSCVGPIGEVGERGKEVAGRILRELVQVAGLNAHAG